MFNYKSASYTMAGTACLVIILNTLFWHFGSEGHSLVPGFSFAAGLATPVLCAWLGISIKQWKGADSLWVIIPLGIIGLALLCAVAADPDFFTFDKSVRECLAMIILGYIIPEKLLETFSEKEMLVPSILLCMASILIYTCIALVRTRMALYPIVDGYADMKELSLTLLQISEAVSAFVAVFFVIAVSFSQAGIAIGSLKWMRVILAVLCVLVFIRSVVDICPRLYFIIRIIANPVFIYIIVWISRHLKKSNAA